MLQEYNEIFHELNKYLISFRKKGFDDPASQKIRKLISDIGDTPLKRVFSTFGLDEFSRCLTVTAMLCDVSFTAANAVKGLCTVKNGITPGLISALFYGTYDISQHIDALGRYSPLSCIFMGTAPFFDTVMTLKKDMAYYIHTGIIIDESIVMYDEEVEDIIPLRSNMIAQEETGSIIDSCDITEPFIIQLCGEKGSGRHTAAMEIFHRRNMGTMLLRMDSGKDEDSIRELSAKILLSGDIPIVEKGKDVSQSIYCGFLDRLAEETGLVVSISTDPCSSDELYCDTFAAVIQRPDVDEQYLLWKKLSEGYDIDNREELREIAGEFEMNPGTIKKALSFAGRLSGGRCLTASMIKKGCYCSVDRDMGEKAVRIKRVFGWEDLIIPEKSRILLKAACDQVKLRFDVYEKWGFSRKLPYGKGVSMIFTGPPGTGKTMGAQVIASELGMDIYKVSLSNIVSKYIGETEKNLEEIFTKAKKCRVILFFDEADVLFSKRTEVKDSNDKYSNMESAFLLQKIEEYTGVVILATNLVQNFDEAFKRRMRFIIDFPFPDESYRREMWKTAFPDKTPVKDIDIDFLAKYELSGSNIKNIALHAAFLASASESSDVEMKHIILAVKNEFSKSGKTFTAVEAGEYCYLLEG